MYNRNKTNTMRRFYTQIAAPKLRKPTHRASAPIKPVPDAPKVTPTKQDQYTNDQIASQRKMQTKLTSATSGTNFLLQPLHTFIHGTRVLSSNVSKALEVRALEFNKKRGGVRSRADGINFQSSKRDVYILASYIPLFYFFPPLLATVPLLIRYFPHFVPSSYITQDRWLKQMQLQETRRLPAGADLIRWVDSEMKKIAVATPGTNVGTAVKNGASERDIYLAKEWLRLREHQISDPTNRLPRPGQGPNSLIPFYDVLSRHFNLFLLPGHATGIAARIAGMGFEGLPGTRARLVQWLDDLLKDDELIKKGFREQYPISGADTVFQVSQSWQDAELVEALENRGRLNRWTLANST
jgi:hypothetical protein